MAVQLSFNQKIVSAACVVVIAAFAAFSVYNDYLQRKTLQDNLQTYLADAGSLTAENISNWLSGRILLLENLAANTQSEGAYRLVPLLQQKTLEQTFEFSYLGAANGDFTMRPDSAMPADYDPRTRPWFKDAKASGKTILTAPYVDAATGDLIMTIATPAGPDVVGGDLNLKVISGIINALEFNGLGYAFLVSGDGDILVHPDTDLQMKKLQDVYPQNTPQINSALSEAVLDGQKRMLTFVPVHGLPGVEWYVGLSVDQDKAFASLTSFRISALIAAVIALAAIVLLLSLLMRYLLQPLNSLGHALDNIAKGEGDLTKRLPVHSRDEFGRLAMAFNQFVERIHESISQVAQTSSELNDVALRVLDASNANMASSDQQSARTNSVAAAINQLGAAAQEIARNAADASTQASGARDGAEQGSEVVSKTIAAMQELSNKIRQSSKTIEQLSNKTEDIGRILEVIQGISEQTNLLALNAAIEAARAGETGRGFAVVADEVRNLAHRTQSSAQEIQVMIEGLRSDAASAVTLMSDSQQYSEHSVSVAAQAGERLHQITLGIGEIDNMNQSVATATEEQTSVIESLNVDITDINMLNQEGVDNLQATLRACTSLEQQVTRLRELVGSFRI
ncbi:methyl-accepting chemotaxis protein [Pseudomonas neustonica]|uniref:Methyl-accepting chemotaxis protein n=1 Tax=Pseudomonas neustonica TaxID=2487346 RepID=A0ABX9XN27_9PSED|nr:MULTISPECIES: methyl-accepting chemotaxis protein [Pseudomonas]ROZ86965.1 methyl-accepting chemotaxis protein [Pseudomonas sp. SSM44]ROZ88419.1 methyl-accepting chemotaxis protein [Pseudomonas neustonica]|tara:strand:- start:4980 stop:6851 length:1872 start_codon:yes stop_codon:yes gene_type:complete